MARQRYEYGSFAFQLCLPVVHTPAEIDSGLVLLEVWTSSINMCNLLLLAKHVQSVASSHSLTRGLNQGVYAWEEAETGVSLCAYSKHLHLRMSVAGSDAHARTDETVRNVLQVFTSTVIMLGSHQLSSLRMCYAKLIHSIFDNTQVNRLGRIDMYIEVT